MADVYTPVPWHNADIVARALTILGCNVAYAETQSPSNPNPVGSSFASETGWSRINKDGKRLGDLTDFKTAFCNDNADDNTKCAFTADCGGLAQMIGWMWPGVNNDDFSYGGLLKPSNPNLDVHNDERAYQKANHHWGDWHIIPSNGASLIASGIKNVEYFSNTFTIDHKDILPGSLIFFQEDGALTHVGIYIGTITNLGRHLVIESTANKFYYRNDGDDETDDDQTYNASSLNSYIAGVGFTTVGEASDNFDEPYNNTGLDNTYKYGWRKWRNYSTSRADNCWVAMGRFINVQYDELDITWEPDTNDATKGIFYVTAHEKPSIVYPPETTTNTGVSIFPLNPVTSHVNVKATLFNGNVEPSDPGTVLTDNDKYPEHDGTSGRYSYEWVTKNEGEATETTFAIGLSLKYDLRIGSDIPTPENIPIVTTPPEHSDIPEPLEQPTAEMRAPSSDTPDPITYPSSKWYHAEDLGQTHTTPTPDLSYIDFWFNGKHAREFKLYRVSDGNRYNANLTSSINDTTIDIPGRDGQLWFYAKYQPRKFTVNYAFDSLTDSDVRAIRRWLNKDAYGDLIFTEAPSRAYSVKVTSQPTFNFVPFNTYDGSGEQNLYRGEGKIEFTAYYPFAHTPNPYNNYIGTWNGILNGWDGYSWPDDDDPENTIADKVAQHYAYYSQRLPKDEDDYWYKTTIDNSNILFVRNYGDLGMPIMIGLTSSTSTLNLTIYRHTVNGYALINQLVIAPHDEDLIWNSATGLIYEMNNNKQIVHNEKCLKGNTVMALEPLENPATDYYAFVYEGGELNNDNLDIKFWYY